MAMTSSKEHYGLPCPACHKAAFYYEHKPVFGEQIDPQKVYLKLNMKWVTDEKGNVECQYCGKMILRTLVDICVFKRFNYRTGEEL